jgi:hypothetical protein
MTLITIDGVEYNFDELSDNVKKNVDTIRFIDSEIVRLQNLIAIQQTARTVYANILQKELESTQA